MAQLAGSFMHCSLGCHAFTVSMPNSHRTKCSCSSSSDRKVDPQLSSPQELRLDQSPNFPVCHMRIKSLDTRHLAESPCRLRSSMRRQVGISASTSSMETGNDDLSDKVGQNGARETAAEAPLSETKEAARELDDKLSWRPLDLDPAGYFLISVNSERREIMAQHFRNVIDDKGLACDPETGQVIPCDGSYKPKPYNVYRGRTAKELSVAIIETPHMEAPVTMLSHANYLGREFQKAEQALFSEQLYIQD